MNRSNRRTAAWLAVISLLTHLLTASTVHAQATWTNAAGGNWSDAVNWDTGVSPGPGTNVFLTNPYSLYSPYYPIGYFVTNDVVNNTIGDLTIYNLSGYRAVLYSAQNGFNPAGDVSIGYAGTLMVSNSTATIGGSMTISNYGQLVLFNGANVTVNGALDSSFGVWVQGTNTVLSVLGGFNSTAASSYPYFPYAPYDLTFFNNGTLNVGGTNAASANASSVTFTNAGSMTFNGYYNGIEFSSSIFGTINASTNTVGIYNTGTMLGWYGHGIINGKLLNETNGIVDTYYYGPSGFTIQSFPTNRGQVFVRNTGPYLTINEGDFVNQGLLDVQANPVTLSNGSFLNDTNGVFTIGLYGGSLNSKYVLNRGSILVTNASYDGFKINSTLTNEGTITLHRRPVPNRNAYAPLQASNIVNSGTILVQGPTNVFTHSDVDQEMVLLYAHNIYSNAIHNLPGGVVTTTNGAILGLGYYVYAAKPLINEGKLIINSDSTIGIGAWSPVFSSTMLYLGLSSFSNDGVVDLRGGALGVAQLSNAPAASIEGYGDIGLVVYSNKVSGSLLTTNYTRDIFVSSIANSGTIAPNGVLNAGGITNLAGGKIIGAGTIASYNVAEVFVGETLVTSNINTGARIQNNIGATILASGGTLVLQNGLVNNSNAGTLGATNGGLLQLGDGTMALTNNGLLSVHNGGLNLGYLHNNGIIEIVNSSVTFSNKLFNAGRYISDPSINTFLDDVTISPSGTLEGGVGDVFDFKKNLIINSTNTSLFDLINSTVSFTGGGDHTNAITGLDFGWDQSWSENHGYQSTNFAYGTLLLGSTDHLYLIDGDGIGSNSNALYISVLDIGGTTNNLTLLHTPMNIYYRNGLAANEYLGGLTYALDGGGFLVPIPEPSTALLFLTAAAAFVRNRRRA